MENRNWKSDNRKGRFYLHIGLFVLLIIVCRAQAQTGLSFRAVIHDSITREALPGATVMEKGSGRGTAADMSGMVRISLPARGKYTFIVQYIGYNRKEFTVEISRMDTLFEILLAPQSTELEEVTVTSVRTNSRIENIPTRIEVLGTDAMDEENGIKPGNVVSLLGDIAGIQLQQVSAASGNTYARIQGMNGRYTQLLKDGSPLFGGLSNSFGILQIPPLDLRQIEIIKGSSSTLYGGDAIGGIINFISREPQKNLELSFTGNITSLLEADLNAYSSKRFGKIGYTIFAGQVFQKQKDVDGDGLTDVPRVSSTVINPRLFVYFNPKNTLTINYSGVFDKRSGGQNEYFSGDATDTLYHVVSNMDRHIGVMLFRSQFSEDQNLTVRASASYINQDLSTKFYTFPARQVIWYSEASYFIRQKHMNWVAGINLNGDYFDNRSDSLTGIPDYSYQTMGLFLQNTWTPWEKFTIETGMRLDWHNRYGFFPLPRLSLMYHFSRMFTARLNGGMGYKIPNLITYLDTETDLDKVVDGITLRPELAWGANADVNFHHLFPGNVDVTINQSFFYTSLDRPVYDSSSSQLAIKLANGSRPLTTMGLQTYVRVLFHGFEFYLGYVLTDVKKHYDTLHPRQPVTPGNNLSWVVMYEIAGKWRFGLEGSWIASQVDQNYNRVKNYVLLAAMIQFNTGHFTFVLNGENLLDFRQNRIERIFDGPVSNPVFHQLWAPIDGRVINLSVKYSL